MVDGTQITFDYNSAGQRGSYQVSKGGVTSLLQTFQYRGDELAEAVLSTTTALTTDTCLYTQSGAPLELIRVPKGQAPQRYWYEEDGRGNVVALTDINGNVMDRYSYDAWGYPTSVSEQVPQRLRYAGYWYDQELGWYWVSVRAYSPALKRWLQPDPSQQDGVRTYVYADDDPIDITDPTGLDSDPCNVFFFGNWCARNVHARFLQAVLQHQRLTIMVYVLPHSQRTQVSGALHGPDAARVVTDLAAGTFVLFGQKRIDPTFDPSHRFKGATIDEIAAKLRSGELSPDDIEIEAFVWGPDQQLVTLNNRSLAALSKAGFLPTNVKVVDYASLSKGQQVRLREEPIEGVDYTIPGTRIPVTPARNDPTILEMISLPGYEYELYPEGEVPIEDR